MHTGRTIGALIGSLRGQRQHEFHPRQPVWRIKGRDLGNTRTGEWGIPLATSPHPLGRGACCANELAWQTRPRSLILWRPPRTETCTLGPLCMNGWCPPTHDCARVKMDRFLDVIAVFEYDLTVKAKG